MNKSLIIGAALIAAGAGVYFSSQGQNSTNEVMEQATGAATKAADDAAASAKAAEEAEAKAAEEAATAAAEAEAVAAKAAEEAAAKAAEEAAAATEAASDTASSVESVITDALSGAVDAASEPVAEGAGEVATDAATDAANAENSGDPALSAQDALLTADGFDADKVGEMVDGSDLDPMKKALLKAAIDQARENPEMVKVVIEQVKTALGM